MRLDIIVERVVFHNDENGWTVLRFRKKTRKYDDFAAVGLLAKCPIAGDDLILIGDFVDNPRYGTQVKPPPPTMDR